MNEVVSALDTAPEEISAVLTIQRRGKRVTNAALDEALLKAMDEEREIQRVLDALMKGETLAARAVPVGF
jgi:hypothetical protein